MLSLPLSSSSLYALYLNNPVFFLKNCLLPAGYQVYLVGGCVRDLVLRRTPKDFDIITSAELKEVAASKHFDVL